MAARRIGFMKREMEWYDKFTSLKVGPNVCASPTGSWCVTGHRNGHNGKICKTALRYAKQR